MRLHETRVHRKTTIPTNVVPRFIPTNCRRRNLPTDIGRRNIPTNHVRRYIPTDVKKSVGIPSELSNPKRLYNGHMYLSATVTWFVGIPSENTDGIPTTLLLIGMSSEFRRNIPTNFRRLQRLHFLSECRRKVVGKFRRTVCRRNSVGNGRRNSDDFIFLDLVKNLSVFRRKCPTTLVSVGRSVGIRSVFLW
ncbi:hypothetical protein DY000_02009582 [Brassica cretica]|uniref:Uncharacterized protein n=1 Tax=Brassica cretica TaxID=69181 RepID=A0ABQ7C7M6_BRACR|nr:hypothetical protein DY000_02009582 [Brassica cretica]